MADAHISGPAVLIRVISRRLIAPILFLSLKCQAAAWRLFAVLPYSSASWSRPAWRRWRAWSAAVLASSASPVVFKAAPWGRSRRRHGAQAVAPAGAPAPAGPTPVGWRERSKNSGRLSTGKFQGRAGFDKGTLAMAQIGLLRPGQKPARSLDQRTGHRPLSNPPLRLPRASPPSAVTVDT